MMNGDNKKNQESWTVSIIIAFRIYASFTTKQGNEAFCLDTLSTGQILFSS